MTIKFAARGWEDYTYWVEYDRKMALRTNDLLSDISREPFEGLGAPEPLRHRRSGYWSRRINREHRLIYKVKSDSILVAQCRHHYAP